MEFGSEFSYISGLNAAARLVMRDNSGNARAFQPLGRARVVPAGTPFFSVDYLTGECESQGGVPPYNTMTEFIEVPVPRDYPGPLRIR